MIYIHVILVFPRTQKRKHVISVLLMSKLRLREIKLTQAHTACLCSLWDSHPGLFAFKLWTKENGHRTIKDRANTGKKGEHQRQLNNEFQSRASKGQTHGDCPMYLASPNQGLRDLTEDIASTIGALQGTKWREREDTTSLKMEIWSPYLYKPSRN